MDRKKLSGEISVVDQHPILLQDTSIKYNLLYGIMPHQNYLYGGGGGERRGFVGSIFGDVKSKEGIGETVGLEDEKLWNTEIDRVIK